MAMGTSDSKQTGAGKSSRRDFIKRSSILVASGAVAGAFASQLNIARAAHAYGSDMIKLGLVGCGGRGQGAAVQALNTTGGDVKLTALADAFPDAVQRAIRGIGGTHKDKMDIPQERQFSGFDAYKQIMSSDVDVVLLATPPGFRPLHFEAAINAGKHVFMEKPVAVDAPGVRRVLAANEEAKKKNLAVAVGLQRRHESAYQDTIKRLQDGAIGRILFTRVYWNGATPWIRPRRPEQTELEYQMRNWYFFNWLCGDHIVEQHIHNLDVINWLNNGYPVEANGQGGRQARTGKDQGEIYDHHFLEYTYADGSKMFSQCRHIENTWPNVSEHAHGTEGECDISGGKIYDPQGKMVYQTGGAGDGWQQEHHDLFALLRRGELPNEGDYGAKSSMTAIMGRMATYSGQKISWDQAFNSQLQLANVDDYHSYDQEAPVKPDANGDYKIAKPGEEPFPF
jgi:predicted dehydrogenase